MLAMLLAVAATRARNGNNGIGAPRPSTPASADEDRDHHADSVHGTSGVRWTCPVPFPTG